MLKEPLPANEEEAPRPRRRHRVWKWLGYSALVAFALGAIAAGAGAWWLWGWRAGELTYHPSWTPEQRAELHALDANICHAVEMCLGMYAEWDEMLSHVVEEQTTTEEEEAQYAKGEKLRPDVGARLLKRINPLLGLSAKWRYVITTYGMRSLLVEWRSALKQVAAGGHGEATAHRESGMTLAQVASRFGQLELVRGLVLHGADPNNGLIIPDSNNRKETLFQTTLACIPFFGGAAPPVQERQALLEWMMAEHGALIDGGQEDTERIGHDSLLHAMLSAFREEDSSGAMVEWLLEHGLKPNLKDVTYMEMLLHIDHMLPTMRRIHQKGYLGILATDAQSRAKILRSAITNHDCEDGQSVERVRWALDELGADPSFTVLKDESEADEAAKVTEDDAANTCNADAPDDEEDDDGETASQVTRNNLRAETPTIELCLLNILCLPKGELSKDYEQQVADDLAILDLLLERGLRATDFSRFTPQQPAVREQYKAILSKHGISLPEQKEPEEDDEHTRQLMQRVNRTFNNL